MGNGRVAGGVLLMAVAIWALITRSNPAVRYLGGAAIGTVGLALMMTGLKKK